MLDPPITMNLAAGLETVQNRINFLHGLLYKSTVTRPGTNPKRPSKPHLDKISTRSKPTVGLGLLSKFAQGDVLPNVSVAVWKGLSAFQCALDETSTALAETELSTRYSHSSEKYFVAGAEQSSEKHPTLDEASNVDGTTEWHAFLTTMKAKHKLEMSQREEKHLALIASLKQRQELDIEEINLNHIQATEQRHQEMDQMKKQLAQKDASLMETTTILKGLDKEKMYLQSECMDLERKLQNVEKDLSYSSLQKVELKARLTKANKRFEEGKLYCKQRNDEWQSDLDKLRLVTRLLEAEPGSAVYLQVLQKHQEIEAANVWLENEVRHWIEVNQDLLMKTESIKKRSIQRFRQMEFHKTKLEEKISICQEQLWQTQVEKNQIKEELQQERLRSKQRSPGGSGFRKPNKFSHVAAPVFQTLSHTRAPPQFGEALKSGGFFGNTTASGLSSDASGSPTQSSLPTQSDTTFGQDAAPQDLYTSAKTTTSAAPRQDSNLVFRDRANLQESSTTGGAATTFGPRKRSKFTFGGTTPPQTASAAAVTIAQDEIESVPECSSGGSTHGQISPTAVGHLLNGKLEAMTFRKEKTPANIDVGSSGSTITALMLNIPDLDTMGIPLETADNTPLPRTDVGRNQDPETIAQGPKFFAGRSSFFGNFSSETGYEFDPSGGIEKDPHSQTSNPNVFPDLEPHQTETTTDNLAQKLSSFSAGTEFVDDSSVKADFKTTLMEASNVGKFLDNLVFGGIASAEKVQQPGNTSQAPQQGPPVFGTSQTMENKHADGAVQETMFPPTSSFIESASTATNKILKPSKNREGRAQKRAALGKLAKARARGKGVEVGGEEEVTASS